MIRIKEDETRENIGALLKRKRIQKGISQTELSRKTEIKRTYLSQIEHGKRIPKFKTVELIAFHLGEDTDSLIKEAKEGCLKPEVELALLLAELLKAGDREKMKKVVKSVRSLA